MLIGQTIVAEFNNSTTVSTMWFPRQGDAVTSTYEVIAISSSDATLTVDVFTKNGDEQGGGASATGASSARTGTGTSSFRKTALKELVRYDITLEHGGTADDNVVYCHFRMLVPSFEATGAQGI